MVQESAINQFRIGDIMEVNMGRKGGYTVADVDDRWVRFWDFPLRDSDDVCDAREIVESHGSSLGWGHAALNNEPGRRSDYRTVTP